MRTLVPLADAAALPGKAGLLARLIRAGLPVPDGIVLAPAARGVAADDDAARDAVDTAARRLAPLAVRSSASIEDQPGGAGAGVLASHVDVPAADVWPAIRAVWDSADTPLAAAYARERGAAVIEVAVIVQRFVPGARVTVYTRPPGSPDADEAWVEAVGGPARRLPRGGDDPLVALALAAERAIDAPAGADVELVVGADRTWVVQARPIVHPPPRGAAAPPPPAVLAWTRDTPGVTWRLDVTHNPDPISPAQAGLVAAVQRAGASPWRMHVAAGYLYVADDPAGDEAAAAAIAELEDARALRARFDAIALSLDDALPVEPCSLAAAVDGYVAAYRVFARELAPLVAAARRRLPALLATRLPPAEATALAARLAPRRPGALDVALADAARGALTEPGLLALARDFAPGWDVAAPTFAERPEDVHAAIMRLRLAGDAVAPVTAMPIDEIADSLAIGRMELAVAVAYGVEAAAIAEEDDARFARAQAIVRRALLAAGKRLGLDDPEDACWLPLDDLLAAERADELDRVAAHARATAARAAAARARAWAMPLVVRDGEPAELRAPGAADRWTGTGTGPRVSGPVHRLDELARAALVPHGSIAVVATVTPALALVLAGARAIVSEHGGVLDHGAAIARELGVTCVVGCAGAWRELRDGDLVEVDGEAGVVRRIG